MHIFNVPTWFWDRESLDKFDRCTASILSGVGAAVGIGIIIAAALSTGTLAQNLLISGSTLTIIFSSIFIATRIIHKMYILSESNKGYFPVQQAWHCVVISGITLLLTVFTGMVLGIAATHLGIGSIIETLGLELTHGFIVQAVIGFIIGLMVASVILFLPLLSKDFQELCQQNRPTVSYVMDRNQMAFLISVSFGTAISSVCSNLLAQYAGIQGEEGIVCTVLLSAAIVGSIGMIIYSFLDVADAMRDTSSMRTA